jgi:hypothetical protein
VTSRLGTGKWLTLFYSVVIWNNLSGSEFEAGSDLRCINALSVYFGMRKREERGDCGGEEVGLFSTPERMH